MKCRKSSVWYLKFQFQKSTIAHHTFICRSDQVRSGLFFYRRKLIWTNLNRNRQNYRRIDTHGIIVVERSTTINVYTRGRHSDINGVETPGTVAGMGGGNSGLQEQWFICPAVVQGEGNHTNHLLSLGTRTIIYFWFNDAQAWNNTCCCVCGITSTKTGVLQHSGTFRYTASGQCQHRHLSAMWSRAAENTGWDPSHMLNDFTGADKVYIACGYTDLRKGIDGLARMVQQQFELDPFSNTLFLFCGRRRDRIKGLYWERDGFILLYKRLEQGTYQWPRSKSEVRSLTPQQYRWLMEGLKIEQPKAHRPVTGLTVLWYEEAASKHWKY